MPMWTRSCSTLARSLCEPAHLPVRDRNARGPDEHEADDAGNSEPAVRGVSPAPAPECERAENAADQPADVAADRDVAAARVVREADSEVDHDERDRIPAEELSGGRPFDHGHRAEDAEDRPRRSYRDAFVRVERTCRSREPAHDVQAEETRTPEVLLDGRPEPPEGEHVEPDVDQVRVQEGRREQAPPVALRHRRPEEREPGE